MSKTHLARKQNKKGLICGYHYKFVCITELINTGISSWKDLTILRGLYKGIYSEVTLRTCWNKNITKTKLVELLSRPCFLIWPCVIGHTLWCNNHMTLYLVEMFGEHCSNLSTIWLAKYVERRTLPKINKYFTNEWYTLIV